MGEWVCNMLGLPISIFKKLEENKWMWFMGALFIGNMIKSNMLQTGAFEVHVENTLVFSKLQRGRIFDKEELQIILLENGLVLK